MLLSTFVTLLCSTDEINAILDDCDPHTGPPGAFGRISAARYQGFQDANCLTNAYIQEKSKGELD